MKNNEDLKQIVTLIDTQLVEICAGKAETVDSILDNLIGVNKFLIDGLEKCISENDHHLILELARDYQSLKIERFKEVFPVRTPVNSPNSLSDPCIAFASNVFLTTANFTPALKQARRKFEVFPASSPEISAK